MMSSLIVSIEGLEFYSQMELEFAQRKCEQKRHAERFICQLVSRICIM